MPKVRPRTASRASPEGRSLSGPASPTSAANASLSSSVEAAIEAQHHAEDRADDDARKDDREEIDRAEKQAAPARPGGSGIASSIGMATQMGTETSTTAACRPAEAEFGRVGSAQIIARTDELARIVGRGAGERKGRNPRTAGMMRNTSAPAASPASTNSKATRASARRLLLGRDRGAP